MSTSTGLVYLAGAIDGVDPISAEDWREKASADLAKYGFATFSPVHAFVMPDHTDAEIAQAIIGINEQAVFASGMILANLSTKSFGTPIECFTARANRTPVFCFGGAPQSLYRHYFQDANPCRGGWDVSYEDALEAMIDYWEQREPS